MSDVDYKLPKIGGLKWFAIISITFICSLLLYFPILNKIDNTIRSVLESNPTCKVDYSDYEIKFFMPKIVIKDLSIPRRCFRQRGADLKSKETIIHLHGFSFSPFGPHFKLDSNFLSKPLSANITIGLSEIAINLNEQIIPLKDLSKINPNVSLNGSLTISALVHIGSNKVTKLKLHAFSKDIQSNSITVSGFKLSRLNFNNLLIKAESKDGKNINLNKLILGDVNSPIRANFNGKINPNYNSIAFSKIDLTGELAFSKKFLESYSIIEILMNKFDKKDDFYQLKLEGSLMRPIPSSPR